MTDVNDFDMDEASKIVAATSKFVDDDHRLPQELFPLSDGSYGDRQAFDAEHEEDDEDATEAPDWGKGVLLLNPSTKSYLTPFGFKALFKQRPKVIRVRFEQAGLDLRKSYFRDHSPDVLIHCEDDRFVPPSHLPREDGLRPLTLRFREEDIYLQNFNREGTKGTGSYISYARAGQDLRERHAEVLQGLAAEPMQEMAGKDAVPATGEPKTPKRGFKFRPRTRGLARHSRPSAAKHG